MKNEREGSEFEEYVRSIWVWITLFQVTSMPMITPSFHPDSAAASIALPVPHPRSQNPPPPPPSRAVLDFDPRDGIS